jgi:hypothetical protein
MRGLAGVGCCGSQRDAVYLEVVPSTLGIGKASRCGVALSGYPHVGMFQSDFNAVFMPALSIIARNAGATVNAHPPQQFVPIYAVVCQSPPPEACSAPSWCHRPYPADTWRLLNERVALWPIAFHCLLSLLLYFFYATVD